jgi:hypothetical protein
LTRFRRHPTVGPERSIHDAEEPWAAPEFRQRIVELVRMFDRYSIASTKDIEAALQKATLPAGNSVGQRQTR